LSKRSKITVISLVILAVIAILLVPDLALLSPGEEETGPGEEAFKATDDPYSTYNEALEEGSPAVIKFYARW